MEGNLILGMETASPFSINFIKPTISNPWNIFQISIYQNLHKLLASWSYQEAQMGTGLSYHFLNRLGKQSVGYDYCWRNIFKIGEAASPSIRMAAGHSTKSALKYTLTSGSLNDYLLPTSGSLFKLTQVFSRFCLILNSLLLGIGRVWW